MRLSKNEEIPMIDSNTCDFSFAGLKTAVLYMLKNRTVRAVPYVDRPDKIVDIAEITKQEKMRIAHEFENAVADVLWRMCGGRRPNHGAHMMKADLRGEKYDFIVCDL